MIYTQLGARIDGQLRFRRKQIAKHDELGAIDGGYSTVLTTRTEGE